MNKKAQEKYIELQMLSQQMQQVQKQLQLLEQQMLELNSTKDGLDELAKTKEETEILVPISSGIFVKAKVKDNKTLTVNVGSNVAVEKTVPETKSLIEEQLTEIKNFQQELAMNLQRLALKGKEIEQEISKLVK